MHPVLSRCGSTLRSTQLESLLRKQPEAVVLMFDNDDAGAQASAQARRTVGSSVRCIEAVYPTDGPKDPDALTFEQKLLVTKTVESQCDRRRESVG